MVVRSNAHAGHHVDRDRKSKMIAEKAKRTRSRPASWCYCSAVAYESQVESTLNGGILWVEQAITCLHFSLQEHIQEVLNKWQSIDDEIWAKIIVLERNRRVAKAYARAPVLTVNGSDDGFDGFRIGLAGFENPMRDKQTEEVKRAIGQGCKIKMDDSGNILVKRIAKEKVYVKQTSEDNAIANDILKLPNGSLEAEKPVKLFDMKKFQQNVSREMRRAYPDRRKLECQCISAIAFVRNEQDILDSPCWIMLINIVAMDMLKSKMPPSKTKVDRMCSCVERPSVFACQLA